MPSIQVHSGGVLKSLTNTYTNPTSMTSLAIMGGGSRKTSGLSLAQ